ncbi:MAG: peptidoglycan DD-metalloendopeptidase family protein [Chitinophagaceae bacterium]|nr:peptidoglycan DD-metalloendopeptidase family protein [Chitinophagaceae bacterium]
MPPTSQQVIHRNQSFFYPVVPFKKGVDRLKLMDFTENNSELTTDIIENTNSFSEYIDRTLSIGNYKFGIGGYNELRTVYSRSALFNSKPGDEPRRLHLGTDIWGKTGTPVSAFMGGMVHSFANNDQFGDYGPTIVLVHQLEGMAFYTLYGHLGIADIANKTEGQYISRAEKIGHFGEPRENGQWPSHLHFQVIMDIGMYEGDYPGVCKFSERQHFLANCPDPDSILQLNSYIS